jgi:hypothetical protein
MSDPKELPSAGAYRPIDTDVEFNRHYIPMLGGWEMQTKGNGSTFRLCDPKGERLPIPDSPYLHETLERMARDANAEWGALWFAASRPQPAAGEVAMPKIVGHVVRTSYGPQFQEVRVKGSDLPSDPVCTLNDAIAYAEARAAAAVATLTGDEQAEQYRKGWEAGHAAAVARHGGGGGPNIPSGLINRIEAPTGQPPRAWTAQEKIDAAEAMRRIREREAHPAAPGGVDDSVTLTELRNCCASWEPDVRVLGNVRAADAVRALDAALTAAGMGQSANPENDND